ncbi:MAG: GNAT family N-acetyltransferase [Candidatus Micrarchaeia archaeon]
MRTLASAPVAPRKTASGFQVSLRRFRMHDYDTVAKQWKEAGVKFRPEGIDSPERIAFQLRHPSSLYFVAEAEGRPAGAIFATHDGRNGWINQLAVSPEFQKKGIGSLLLQEAEAHIFGMDVGMAFLLAGKDSPSLEFFKKCGYRFFFRGTETQNQVMSRMPLPRQAPVHPEIIVRRLRPSDYDAVLRLWDGAKIFYEQDCRDSRKRFADQCNSDMCAHLAAEQRGEIVGVLFSAHDWRKFYSDRLVVAESARRQGIALLMFGEVERLALRLGLEMVSFVYVENSASTALHLGMGCSPSLEYELGGKRTHSK